jgi:hypothetical protein
MAYEIPGFANGTDTASADLSAQQFRFVKSSGAGTVTVCAAATDLPIGVLQNKPVAGQAANVMITGVSKVVAGAAVAAGVEVGPDATGRAIAAVTGTRSKGISREAATAAGQIIAVDITHERLVP